MEKLIIHFLFITCCCSFGFSQTFNIDTVVFKTKYPVISATFFDGYFYCLDKERNIFRVNTENDYKEIPNSGLQFKYITNIDGKLIALETLYNTFTEYHFDDKEFKKKGRISYAPQQIYEDDFYKISAICGG